MADIEVTETTKTYSVDRDVLIKPDWEESNTWWYKLATFLDRLRIIPRGLMTAYGLIFWYTTQWFMALPDPTNAQAAFVSTVVGAGAAWFGLYVGTGGKK